MVGGTEEAFERAEPFLEEMGKAVIHAGGAGLGPGGQDLQQHAARRLDGRHLRDLRAWRRSSASTSQTFFDIASKASGQCWSMTSYCPVPGVGPETPADRDYEGGFAAALMLKDLRLAMEAAQSVDAYTPMGAQAEELYTRFADLGGAGKDFSGDHQDDRRQLGGAGPDDPRHPDEADLNRTARSPLRSGPDQSGMTWISRSAPFRAAAGARWAGSSRCRPGRMPIIAASGR